MAVEQAKAARALLRDVVTLSGQEQVVIGSSHVGAFPSLLGWPGSRILLRSGENGADLVLLEVLTGERVEERFDEVVLVSGDGIFTDAVSMLGAAGVSVTVVAHPDGCSKRLRMAAGRTVFFNHRLGAMEGAA